MLIFTAAIMSSNADVPKISLAQIHNIHKFCLAAMHGRRGPDSEPYYLSGEYARPSETPQMRGLAASQ